VCSKIYRDTSTSHIYGSRLDSDTFSSRSLHQVVSRQQPVSANTARFIRKVHWILRWHSCFLEEMAALYACLPPHPHVTSHSPVFPDNIIRMLWSTVKEDFDVMTAKIASHINKFEDESRVAVSEVTVIGTRAIQAALTQLVITPQIVLPFTDGLYGRNDKFTGRDTELEGIKNALVRSSTSPIDPPLDLCTRHWRHRENADGNWVHSSLYPRARLHFLACSRELFGSGKCLFVVIRQTLTRGCFCWWSDQDPKASEMAWEE
jgi:hypothetical protein